MDKPVFSGKDWLALGERYARAVGMDVYLHCWYGCIAKDSKILCLDTIMFVSSFAVEFGWKIERLARAEISLIARERDERLASISSGYWGSRQTVFAPSVASGHYVIVHLSALIADSLPFCKGHKPLSTLDTDVFANHELVHLSKQPVDPQRMT